MMKERILVENNLMLRKVCQKLGIPEDEYNLPGKARGDRLHELVTMLTEAGYSKDLIAEALDVSLTTVMRHRREEKYKKLGEVEIDFA